jgi:DNA-binding CsgD family transcriptional regulator
MHAAAACAGLLVVDTSFKVVASNREAVQILTFPDPPEQIRHLDMWLHSEIRNRLVNGKSPSAAKFVTELQSAKRTYLCRSFSLGTEPEGRATARPVLVIILERKGNPTTSMAELRERFALTDREQETVQSILQGLTNKEIAQRMDISPNTVKAFIRLVMVKMRVSTRSGIVGKIVDCASPHPVRAAHLPGKPPTITAHPLTKRSSHEGWSHLLAEG